MHCLKLALWITGKSIISLIKKSPVKKNAFKSFIDLIVINTLIPILFAFAKSQGRDL
jgi:hypothetical protein